jgi:integrase
LLLNLPLASQTKKHILYTLNIILKEAGREHIIQGNPIDDVEPLASAFRERDILTIEELAALFPHDDEKLLTIWKNREYATLFILLVKSEIRSGEARALSWKHILWDLGAVAILQAVKSGGTIGKPKSGEVRGIYLPDRTMDMLSAWHKETFFPEPDHLVFFGSDAFSPLNKKTYIKRILKCAGPIRN